VNGCVVAAVPANRRETSITHVREAQQLVSEAHDFSSDCLALLGNFPPHLELEGFLIKAPKHYAVFPSLRL